MTWRVVAASEVGTSHIANKKGCEDSCWALVDETASGQSVLSIFVADGAGSAIHGSEGAELAIQAAAMFIRKKLELAEFGLNDDLALECSMAVREKIYGSAEAAGFKARNYACTFLGVISSQNATLVMQIGDGGNRT